MISTVILYKNEKESLKRCLDSLMWCDDVVIVHDAHDTHTDPPATRPGVSVIRRILQSDFSAQRNFGMQYTKNEWVLFLDADEELSSELIETLRNFSPDSEIFAYAIPRIDIFWNQRIVHGEVGSAANDGILRLVHKEKGTWEGAVHETFRAKGETKRLDHSIFHYPHQTIAEFLHDVNFYSSIRAKEIDGRPRWQLFGELIIYPPLKFIYTYFIKLGFMDGAAGFVYSFMMSFHSFLVRAKAITKTYDAL